MTVSIWKYKDGYFSIGRPGELQTFCPDLDKAVLTWTKVYKQKPLKIDGAVQIKSVNKHFIDIWTNTSKYTYIRVSMKEIEDFKLDIGTLEHLGFIRDKFNFDYVLEVS